MAAKEEQLTKRQIAFAKWYVETGNATQSALKAGYSKRSARTIGAANLKKPLIKAAIDAELKQAEVRNSATPDEALDILWRIARGETTDDIPIFVDKGVQEITEVRTAANVRKQAAESILKLYQAADTLELKNRKLKGEAEKLERENGSHDVTGRVIIAANTDEMRRIMNERKNSR